MEISLSLICKDEEDKIELWLKNHYNDVDEICILDNGSTDKTKEIIRGFPDHDKKIKLWELNHPHVPFSDSWQEWIPRNVAFWMCSKEWILSIDADEFLDDGWRKKVGVYVNMNQKCDKFAFSAITFWGSFNTIRLNHEKDPGQWYGCNKGYLIKNDKWKSRWSLVNNHCLPLWEGKNLPTTQIKDIILFHYHYAFGIKENDNRRGDIGFEANPNWNFDVKGHYGDHAYEIVTKPFTGKHPQVIRNFLEENNGKEI